MDIINMNICEALKRRSSFHYVLHFKGAKLQKNNDISKE